MSGKMTGIVKWFNADKGWDFFYLLIKNRRSSEGGFCL